MKFVFTFLVILFSVSLYAQEQKDTVFTTDKWHATQDRTHSIVGVVQSGLKAVIDTSSGKKMLIGVATREAFKDTSFSWWFDSEYDGYNVKTKELDGVKDKIKDYNITIVMGTWCSDSRREIPRFFKMLDTLQYPSDKVKLIMVDRKKKDLSGAVDTMNIELVPTIIFYKDGVEAGRITEAPKETLETDTNNIVFNRVSKEEDNN